MPVRFTFEDDFTSENLNLRRKSDPGIEYLMSNTVNSLFTNNPSGIF